MGTVKNNKYINMLEPFEAFGEWWIPGSKSRCTGTLKYIPHEFVFELEILGQLIPTEFGPVEACKIKIVNGTTTGGQSITLYNNFHFLSTISYPGHIISKIHPECAFIGTLFENEKEMIFHRAYYSCYSNEELVGVSGFKSTIKKDGNDIASYTLSYVRPEAIKFKINDFDISTSYGVVLPTEGHDLHAKEDAGFKISAIDYMKHTCFLEQPILSIHSFLELIMDATLPIRDISLISEKIGSEIDGKFYPSPISLLLRQHISFPLPPKKDWFELVFTLYGIRNEINAIMQKWHETRLKYVIAHNLFFGLLRIRHTLNPENRFLTLCRVLEAYHRVKNNETYMPTEEYTGIINKIDEVVPEKHKKHISQRLKYGNELTFRQRLKNIYDTLPLKIQNRIDDQKIFCDKVVNTRNYLTHCDISIKSSALDVKGYMKYEFVLMAICKALFLLEAGIPSEIVGNKLENFKILEFQNFGDG